jgi:hypothetical protein
MDLGLPGRAASEPTAGDGIAVMVARHKAWGLGDLGV